MIPKWTAAWVGGRVGLNSPYAPSTITASSARAYEPFPFVGTTR